MVMSQQGLPGSPHKTAGTRSFAQDTLLQACRGRTERLRNANKTIRTISDSGLSQEDLRQLQDTRQNFDNHIMKQHV